MVVRVALEDPIDVQVFGRFSSNTSSGISGRCAIRHYARTATNASRVSSFSSCGRIAALDRQTSARTLDYLTLAVPAIVTIPRSFGELKGNLKLNQPLPPDMAAAFLGAIVDLRAIGQDGQDHGVLLTALGARVHVASNLNKNSSTAWSRSLVMGTPVFCFSSQSRCNRSPLSAGAYVPRHSFRPALRGERTVVALPAAILVHPLRQLAV